MGAPAQTAGLGLLRSQVRRRLLEHLNGLEDSAATGRLSPRRRGLSAAELADVVGLHVTTVRFHVEQLVAAGLLTAHHELPAGAGRPRKLYAVPEARLEPPADAAERQAYELLRGILAAAGGATGSSGMAQDPQEAGFRWALEAAARLGLPPHGHPANTAGAWFGKVGAVIDLLTGWGHAPEVRTSAGGRSVDVLLHDCPFRDLARSNPRMVCGVHRGLLRGALDGLGEQDAELDLRPLVDSRTCVATLSVPVPSADRGDPT